jgi:hypothetical protein
MMDLYRLRKVKKAQEVTSALINMAVRDARANRIHRLIPCKGRDGFMSNDNSPNSTGRASGRDEA